MFWFKKKTLCPSDTFHKISFELFDQEAKNVSLCGDFNAWDIKATPLEQDKTGRWKTTINLQPGRYEYRFYVDGKWRNDQRPVYLVNNAFGSQNCLIEI